VIQSSGKGGIMKFVVDRKTWFRGTGGIDQGSALLRVDGTRCCIGFVAQQCGIPDSDILNRTAVRVESKPMDSVQCDERWPKWFEYGHNNDLATAYHTNDTLGISEFDREAKLREIFAKHGDEIVFEG
jgi:hypothetical protein